MVKIKHIIRGAQFSYNSKKSYVSPFALQQKQRNLLVSLWTAKVTVEGLQNGHMPQ